MPDSMENTTSSSAEILEKPDLDFIKGLYPDDPNEAKSIIARLNLALDCLKDRENIIKTAREAVTKDYINWECQCRNDYGPARMPVVPTRAMVSNFTAPGITRFLRAILAGQPQVDVRTALALSRAERNFQSEPGVHWVTRISFKGHDKGGSFRDLGDLDSTLYVDAADVVPGRGSVVAVVWASRMQDAGLALYDHTNKEHTALSKARDAFLHITGKENLPGDKYSNDFFDAICAPDKLAQYERYPDLYAEALLRSLELGHQISAEIRLKLLAVLGINKT